MSTARRLRLLCNPIAGGGRAGGALADVERLLAGHGLEVRAERPASASQAAQLARAAAADGEEVVAFGGDGVVRIAAAAVRGTEAVLGVLPGGRGNDFAAALGIPRELRSACAVLADGELRRIDAGEVAGETFVGVASIGLESEVTRLANAAPRVGGRAVYLGATLLGLARWRPASFALELDGQARGFTGYLAAVANSGRFGGGMRIAPEARLDDGLFDVVVIEHGSKLRFALNTPKVFRGTHLGDPTVTLLRAREVRLAADRPFEIYADGDPIATAPALARVLPGALLVRVPRGAGSGA